MYLYVSVRSSRSRTDPYGWPSWFPLPGKKYQIYLGRGGGGRERFGRFHCLSLTAINTHAHPPSTFSPRWPTLDCESLFCFTFSKGHACVHEHEKQGQQSRMVKEKREAACSLANGNRKHLISKILWKNRGVTTNSLYRD